MSIAIVYLGWILWLITPSAVKLLVWIGVCGCGWPILASICCQYAASFANKYRAPSSASAADEITASIIVVAVRIALLLGGNLLLLDRKKCPPARLRDFFSLQYPASLCTLRIILLALYASTALSCIVQ
jgi:hypothetical protein